MGFHGPADTATSGLTLSAVFYNYGNLVGTIQECAINTAMRYEAGSSDTDQRYYPEKLPYDPIQFAAVRTEHDESRLLNNGYNRTLSPYAAFGYDAQVPATSGVHQNRIRWSAQYVNENISDGYLLWDLDAYKDFDHRYGPIQRIVAWGGKHFDICEYGIFLHPVAERAVLSQDSSEGELLIGSGDILSPKAVEINTLFGTQHRWSVIKTVAGIYGYDQRARAFWRLNGGGFEQISLQAKFNSTAYRYSELLSSRSDILNRYPDAPVCVGGVTAFWDRKFGEVGWSFILQLLPNTRPERMAIVYSERAGVFLDQRSYASNYYILIGEDLHSVDAINTPAFVPADQVASQFYLHDALPAQSGVFYGDQYDSYFELTARPGASIFEFDACHLRGTNTLLARMDFSNELGTSFINPFATPDHWEQPEYQENAWRMPIPPYKALLNGGADYGIGSPVRGGYLRMRGTWNTPDHHELHEVSTFYLLTRT